MSIFARLARSTWLTVLARVARISAWALRSFRTLGSNDGLSVFTVLARNARETRLASVALRSGSARVAVLAVFARSSSRSNRADRSDGARSARVAVFAIFAGFSSGSGRADNAFARGTGSASFALGSLRALRSGVTVFAASPGSAVLSWSAWSTGFALLASRTDGTGEAVSAVFAGRTSETRFALRTDRALKSWVSALSLRSLRSLVAFRSSGARSAWWSRRSWDGVHLLGFL